MKMTKMQTLQHLIRHVAFVIGSKLLRWSGYFEDMAAHEPDTVQVVLQVWYDDCRSLEGHIWTLHAANLPRLKQAKRFLCDVITWNKDGKCESAHAHLDAKSNIWPKPNLKTSYQYHEALPKES